MHSIWPLAQVCACHDAHQPARAIHYHQRRAALLQERPRPRDGFAHAQQPRRRQHRVAYSEPRQRIGLRAGVSPRMRPVPIRRHALHALHVLFSRLALCIHLVIIPSMT